MIQDRWGVNLERRILLVGGDEFRPAAVGMDRHLLQSTGKDTPRVAIIPTAAARENPQLAASNGIRHFNGLGADAYGVEVIQRADAENPRIAAQLDGADVIYFTGGSPEHLHSALGRVSAPGRSDRGEQRRSGLGRFQRGGDGAGRGDAAAVAGFPSVAGVECRSQRDDVAAPRAQRPGIDASAAIRAGVRWTGRAGY